MLSVTKAYEDFRLIRVLVVPIGINSQFEDQYRILARLESIPLYDLNKPLYLKGYNPPFKYLDWLKGEMCFDFLRYDQAPSGPTDFEDFQSSKRIVIIMGVLNYPDFINNSEKIEAEMDRFAKRYPNILLKKIMVFNYNFDSSSSLRMQTAPGLLEIFPPDGDCEGGSMLDVHFRQVMAQTSVQLLQAFEHQMDHCEDSRLRGVFPTNPSLTTGFDDKEDMRSGSSKTTKVFRKRPTGRIHKWMGDLSLQVCSPLDAIEHYVAAITESRSQGDSLWLAGALDGYASAILVLQELSFDVEEAIGKDLRTVTQPPPWNPDDDDDYYEEDGDENGNGSGKGKYYVPEVFLLAEERASEALNFYASHVAFKNMELESCFRLAKLYESRMLKHPFRLQKLSEYVMRAVAIPGLSARQQLDAVLEAALVCRRAGLFRKQTKLLYIAALMAADQGNYVIASVLMEHVAEHFGVPIGSLSLQGDDDHQSNNTSSQGTEEEKGSRDVKNGWLDLSISVLSDAAAVAQEAQSPQFTAQVLCRLLALQSTKEFEHATVRSFLSQYSKRTLGLEKFVRKKAPRAYFGGQNGVLSEAAVAALAHSGDNHTAGLDSNGNSIPASSTTGMFANTQFQHGLPPSGASVMGSNTGSVNSFPPRPPNANPPSLSNAGAQSVTAGGGYQRNIAGGMHTAGNYSPTPSGQSDRRSVATTMTTSTFRTQTNLRPTSFNPLADSQSVETATVNTSTTGNSVATGTEAFLASLRSLSVPKLQLTTLHHTTSDASVLSPTRSSSGITGGNANLATPRSPEFRQLTRATQAQAASGTSGRTLSGAHSNSVSQRLLRSLAGDLLALDSATASNFNLFDSNFGLLHGAPGSIAAGADTPYSGIATNTSALTTSLVANNIVSSSNAVSNSATSSGFSGNNAGQVGPTPATIVVPTPNVSLPDAALFHLVDISVARDILHYVTARLVPQNVSLETQEAVWSNLLDAAACLARPSKSLSSNFFQQYNEKALQIQATYQPRIQLPVVLLALHPQRPWDAITRQYTSSAALFHGASATLPTSLRSLYTQEQDKLTKAQSASENAALEPTAAAENASSTSSAFFYDPFAARRQQQQKAAAQALDLVTWCWSPRRSKEDEVNATSTVQTSSSSWTKTSRNGNCLVATLANPLSLAVSLRLVCLLRLSNGDQVEESAAETSQTVVSMFPIEVEIPPRTMHFEVYIPLNLPTLLSQLPHLRASKKVSLKVLGMRMILGGMSEFVTVDSKGAADLTGRTWALQRLVQKQQLQWSSASTPVPGNNKKTASQASAASGATTATNSKVSKLTNTVVKSRYTAKTNEVTLCELPCYHQLYQVDEAQSLESQLEIVSTRNTTESVSNVQVELLPGETLTTRFLLHGQHHASSNQKEQEETQYDVRIRLLPRTGSDIAGNSSSSSSVSKDDGTSNIVTIRDFMLLSSPSTSSTSSNTFTTAGTGTPIVSVNISPLDALAKKQPGQWFALDISLQDAMNSTSRRLNQSFALIVDIVPLSRVQYRALRMLRGLIAPELSVLEAVMSPEETKKWTQLPMSQRVVSLHTRSSARVHHLRWWHPHTTEMFLPTQERQQVTQRLFQRLAPLRASLTSSVPANASFSNSKLSMQNVDLAPGTDIATSVATAAVSLSTTFQPHLIRVKVLSNLPEIADASQNTPVESSASLGREWQSALHNDTSYPVQFTLLRQSLDKSSTSQPTEILSNSSKNTQKVWTVEPHSARVITFFDADVLTNTKTVPETWPIAAYAHWSTLDTVTQRLRQGVLRLALPTPARSVASGGSTTSTVVTSKSTAAAAAAAPSSTKSTETPRTLSPNWTQMEMWATIVSNNHSSSSQPIRLAFSTAQSLLTPVWTSLDIRCVLSLSSVASSDLESVETVMIVEEEYESLFAQHQRRHKRNKPEHPQDGCDSLVTTSTADTLPMTLNPAGARDQSSSIATRTSVSATAVDSAAIPSGVMASGKLRTVSRVSRETSSSVQHRVRLRFTRHGLYTIRFLVRALPLVTTAQQPSCAINREEVWWTVRHPVTIRVCLDE